MKPKRSRRILNLVLNKTSDEEIKEKLPLTLVESRNYNDEQQLSTSPLPEGAEETYEAFRDILDDEDGGVNSASVALEPPSHSPRALTATNCMIDPFSMHAEPISEHIVENIRNNLESPTRNILDDENSGMHAASVALEPLSHSSRTLTANNCLIDPSAMHTVPISEHVVGDIRNNLEIPTRNISLDANLHLSQELTTINRFQQPSPTRTEPAIALVITPSTRPKLLSAASSKMQPSPFTIDPTTSFENSPLPRIDEDIFDCVNIPTPMPSPLNIHSIKKCKDVFCGMHEDWKDSTAAPKQRQSRKRKRNCSKWSDVQRKERTNQGKAFVNRRGKVVEQKTLKSPCSCRLKCSRLLSETDRQVIFSKFWALSSREKQWLFVIRYTKKEKKKRCLNVSKPNNRKFSFKYYLPLVTDMGNENIEVCKSMFLNTLAVSGRTLVTAWKKYDGTAAIEVDRRGRHTKHKKVLVDEMVRSVCDHVRAFQPVESHYLREKTTKLYLDGSLSIARMFTMYKEWFDGNKYSVQAKTERQYRDIVNDNFNLGFFCPKKDQCDQCHTYHNITDPTQEQKNSFEEHQKRKKIARDLKQKSKIQAKQSEGSTLCAVFDFEKVLTCPFGQVSIFYYKRKLSCFNFTIYDMGEKRAVCYMWDETVAKRGANEVSSCLIDFIAANTNKGVTEFVLWSDNCTGQNRNRYVYSSYIYAAMKYKVSITHRFMEKGHTQNEGDSVHSTIENASRTRKIYTPNEWQLLVRWAKNCFESPYSVRNMTQENFYDFKKRLCEKVWCKNIRGQKVKWNNIKEVHVNVEAPNKLLYKYDLSSEEYETVIIAGSTRNSSSNLNLIRAYSQPLKVPLDKYKDLISMCKTNVIPEEHHKYFEDLPHSTHSETYNETGQDSETE